jgi:hypothetical protein
MPSDQFIQTIPEAIPSPSSTPRHQHRRAPSSTKTPLSPSFSTIYNFYNPTTDRNGRTRLANHRPTGYRRGGDSASRAHYMYWRGRCGNEEDGSSSYGCWEEEDIGELRAHGFKVCDHPSGFGIEILSRDGGLLRKTSEGQGLVASSHVFQVRRTKSAHELGRSSDEDMGDDELEVRSQSADG